MSPKKTCEWSTSMPKGARHHQGNADLNDKEILLPSIKMATIKKKKQSMPSVGKDVEEMEEVGI